MFNTMDERWDETHVARGGGGGLASVRIDVFPSHSPHRGRDATFTSMFRNGYPSHLHTRPSNSALVVTALAPLQRSNGAAKTCSVVAASFHKQPVEASTTWLFNLLWQEATRSGSYLAINFPLTNNTESGELLSILPFNLPCNELMAPRLTSLSLLNV